MEGHAKKCVEKYCELAHKKTEQSHELHQRSRERKRKNERQRGLAVPAAFCFSFLFKRESSEWSRETRTATAHCAVPESILGGLAP